MKKPIIFLICCLFLAVTSGSKAIAYDNWYGAGGMYGAGAMMYGGYGGGLGWGWGGGAGGVGQIYSGMGNLIRSEGQRNVLDSQAEINLQKAWQENEKARTLHLENQQKIHAERLRRQREAKARNAEDRQIAIETRARRQEFEEQHRPQPLPTSQLDPATGAISWPTALKSSDFDEVRNGIDQMIQKFSKYGASSDLSNQILAAVSAMRDQLRSQILAIPLPEYSEARKFLDSLAASVR